MKIIVITLMSIIFLFNGNKEKQTYNDSFLLFEKLSAIEEDNFSGFEFPELGYSYDALEPYIDAKTMEIHYSKHHKGYYNRFIKAVKEEDLEKMSITEIFKNVSRYSVAIRNNGGGFYNHSLFWEALAKDTKSEPNGKLSDAINNDFGSFAAFKKEFSIAAKSQFGSGWAWLSVDDKGSLFISATPNQDNPYMDVVEKNGIPILNIDVWEHAYYLKYKNNRGDYVDSYWNIINWKVVEKRYEDAVASKK